MVAMLTPTWRSPVNLTAPIHIDQPSDAILYTTRNGVEGP